MNRFQYEQTVRRVMDRCGLDARRPSTEAAVREILAAADQYAAHMIQEHAGPPLWRPARRTAERKEASR